MITLVYIIIWVTKQQAIVMANPTSFQCHHDNSHYLCEMFSCKNTGKADSMYVVCNVLADTNNKMTYNMYR